MTNAWDEQAAWMREVGAVAASWSPYGVLLTLELGPAPNAPSEARDTPSLKREVPRSAGAGLRQRDE